MERRLKSLNLAAYDRKKKPTKPQEYYITFHKYPFNFINYHFALQAPVKMFNLADTEQVTFAKVQETINRHFDEKSIEVYNI